MRILTAFLALFIYSASFAQFPVSPNLVDENGKRTGHWTILYDSSFNKVHDPDSVHFYRLIRFEAGVPAGKIRDFSRSGYKYWDGYAKSIDPYVFDGESNHYYENGKLSFRQMYVNGKREGPCAEFYPNGNKKATGQFHDDMQEGRWQYFYEDGSLNIDIPFKGDKKIGVVKYYHNNGKLYSDAEWKDGLMNGLYREFNADGNRVNVSHYKNDSLHGVRELFYSDGVIESKADFVKGNRHGQVSFYHPNGALKSKGLYKDGYQTGVWEFFHENGKRSNLGPLVMGNLEGEWHTYYDDGALQRISNYKNDTLNGSYVEYHQNGKKSEEGQKVKGVSAGLWKSWSDEQVLISEGEYVNGVKEGLWKEYYYSGLPQSVSMYRGGNLHGRSIKYFKVGGMLEEAYYKDGLLDSAYVSYYENGNVNGKGDFKNGEKEGEWKYNFENGVLYSVNHYITGKENGWLLNYYTNGALRAEAERRDDIMYGTARFYATTGKLFQSGSYVNGLFDGEWISYDSITGKPEQMQHFLNGKRHGESYRFNEKGKPGLSFYFIHGWEENQANIADSIDHLVRIRDFETAFKCIKWMQKIEKRDFDKPSGRILSLSVEARIYTAMRNYQKAYEFDYKYLKAVEKYQGKGIEYKTALHNVATAMQSLQKYDEALLHFDEAIEIAKPQGLVKAYWNSIINKAYCLYDAGRASDAAALLEEEMQKATQLYGQDSSAAWYLRSEVAEYYYDRASNYEKSEKMFVDLAQDMDSAREHNSQYWFRTQRRIGQIRYYQFDKPNTALVPYQHALAFAERNGTADTPEYGDVLTDVFYIRNTRNALDTAAITEQKVIFEKLKKFVTECSDRSSLADAYLAMGNAVYNIERYPEAYQYFLKAEENIVAAGQANTSRHASVLQSLAFALYYSDRLQSAVSQKYFERSIEIRKKLQQRTSPGFYGALFQLSEFYTLVEKYDLTADILKDVKQIAVEVNDEVMIARCNQKLGEAKYHRWHYSDALPFLKEAYNFYEKRPTDFPDQYINTVGFIAQSYKYRGESDEAIAWGKKNLATVQTLFGDKSSYYYYRVSSLASIYSYANLLSEALKYYIESANGLAQTDGEDSNAAITQQINVIETRFKMNDTKKAIDLGEQLAARVKQEYTENSDLYLSVISLVGRIYDDMNNFSRAEEYFVEAIRVSRKLNGDRSPAVPIELSRLGKFYDRRNRLEEAQSILQEAVDIMRESDYRSSIAITSYLGHLGTVLQELDKNKEAEELYNEAFAITRQDSLNNLSSYIEAGQELSRFYSKVGRFKEAEKLIKRLASLVERLEGKGQYYATTRQDLAYMYYRLGEYEKAEKEALDLLAVLEETVGLDHWLVLRLHNYLGIIYDDQSEYEKSKKEFMFCIDASKRKTVLDESDQSSLATFYSNVARIDLCLGNYESAGKLLDECDRLRKEYKVVPGQQNYAATLSNRASYYQATNKMDKAEATWATLTKSLLDFARRNFYFMTDEEKAQFWKSYNGYFQIFQAFAAQRSKQNPAIVADMYNVQLATKAILLSASNKIRKRILSSRDTSMVSMYYQWTRKREQLAQLYSSNVTDPKQKLSIDSLEIAASLLEKEMNISAEDVSKDKGGESITWKNVQATLAPDEAAVEIIRFKHYNRYWRDSVVYAAMIVTSETKQYPKFVVLNNGKNLEGRFLKFYRNNIIAKQVDTMSYRQYWGPLKDALKGKSRVYLSLDGVYNQINLNTLQDPEGGFLVDDKNLTVVSNTKDVIAIKSRKVKRMSLSSATLFGFPTYFLGGGSHGSPNGTSRDFDRTGINTLPGTKVEIQKVGSILNSHKINADIFTNELASEHAIKQLQHPRVLHIATHGFFDEGGTESNPLLRAGLLLAGAANFIQDQSRVDEENGILTAYEAANLDLENTDLVVLSACETGKGEVQNGEGVYGLQRAFQTAGAQTIVMSLWKVDDAATQQLMTSFYTNWMGGMSKPEALKLAQISLKKQYPHPYYWGAFVMLEN
jgi:antitoxin component YwqK of YwqJK toxin-antitoxin module/CHAT domain-containing protein